MDYTPRQLMRGKLFLTEDEQQRRLELRARFVQGKTTLRDEMILRDLQCRYHSYALCDVCGDNMFSFQHEGKKFWGCRVCQAREDVVSGKTPGDQITFRFPLDPCWCNSSKNLWFRFA